MSKHTPGPWVVQHRYFVHSGAGEAADVVADCDYTDQREQCAANASLIAATPERHAALIAFDAAMCDWYDGSEHSATPELLAAWNLARVAISKAGGCVA